MKKPFIDSKSELHEFRSGQASFVVVEINDAQGDLTGEFPFTNGSGGYQTIGELGIPVAQWTTKELRLILKQAIL